MKFTRLILGGALAAVLAASPAEARTRRTAATSDSIVSMRLDRDTLPAHTGRRPRRTTRERYRRSGWYGPRSAGFSVSNPTYSGITPPDSFGFGGYGSDRWGSSVKPYNSLYGSGHPGIIGW